MCSRPTSTYRFAYLCRAPPLGSIETHSFPNSLVACPGDFTLITRTARACASYPCCVAIYPCDPDRDVFYVADLFSSIHYFEEIKILLICQDLGRALER